MSSGHAVQGLKPVISGYNPASLLDSDSGILLKSTGVEPDQASITAISPWRFSAEISPDMAALREGRDIDLAELIEFSKQRIETNSRKGIITLLEGVGGVMVPLNNKATVLDWMSALKIPVILVAGTYLGTISHTLTAYAAIRSKGLEVKHIILSESADNPVPTAETEAAISRFLQNVAITRLPRVDNGPSPWLNCSDLTHIIK